MPIDPLSPRILAAIVALGGLGTMMTAPEPSWRTAGIGLACLLAYAGLSLVPAPRPKRRRATARTSSTRGARGVRLPPATVPPERPPERPPETAAPAPRGLNDPHPALFRGLRTRQSRVSD